MTLTVEEAILALVTKSANDVAAALGEHLGGGSELRFAQMMTLKARGARHVAAPPSATPPACPISTR